MTLGEKPYICYRGRRYRDTRRRLENTYGEGDCVPMVEAEQEELVVDIEQREPVVDADQMVDGREEICGYAPQISVVFVEAD